MSSVSMLTDADISTTLCDMESLIAVEEGRATEADVEKYKDAVDAALVACEAASPQDRFRLVETPGGNFLLVTNALPKERVESERYSGRERLEESTRDVFDGLLALDQERCGPGLAATIPSVQGYTARAATSISYDGKMLSGSYVVYTKDQLKRSLSPDKRSIVDRILKYVDAPGILDHNNVQDVEGLLWLLFCGPQSVCQNPTCFGRDRDCGVPYPVLLPPIFYDNVDDYAAFINLSELYVYVWYRNYDFTSEAAQCYDLGSVALDRVKKTVDSVRNRFAERNVPIWPISSRTCVFCALYNQNRVCLDLAKNDVNVTAYSPIIIKECKDTSTGVTLSHVLPGDRVASLYPVYDIGALLRILCETTDGEERRKRVRETVESAINTVDD
uniref:Protein UL95 n=1 Tax=Mastomys natalensis cytomegalovirus 1 TaxID=2973541 RepID=A0A9Y1IQV8_9BETA|nr:protein UL95 [Mastomys natalensis cytomegalovirus 1]WEG68953.1 protein UL95 [Mastomys natalensis cytomegalovirus 1]WEG71181.1 protein UL95 [Mastomys natalensis cytomegalovirus 1]